MLGTIKYPTVEIMEHIYNFYREKNQTVKVNLIEILK